jgi:hypothetical protein
MAPKRFLRPAILNAILVVLSFVGVVCGATGAFAFNPALITPEAQQTVPYEPGRLQMPEDFQFVICFGESNLLDPQLKKLPSCGLEGTWDAEHFVEFECEIVRAQGTVVVAASGSNQYIASQTANYTRQLKPGCHFNPGYRQQFSVSSHSTWRATSNGVLMTPVRKQGGGGDVEANPPSRLARPQGNSLIEEFMWNGVPQRWTYTRR